MKKTASSLLAVLTALLLLTGCAGREEEQAEDYAYAAHYTELSDVKGVDMPCCLAGGRLYFEINRAFGQATAQMLELMGYNHVRLRKDLSGNDRFIIAEK